ncbi:MAG: hypothetical protein ACM3XS_10350 [Bacteroidota bacterium]
MKRTPVILFMTLVLTLTLGGAALAAPLALNKSGDFSLYVDRFSLGGRYGITNDITVGAGTLGNDDGWNINGAWQATRTLLVCADVDLYDSYTDITAGLYIPLASGSNVAAVAGGGIDYRIYDESTIDPILKIQGQAEVQFTIGSNVLFYNSLNCIFDVDNSTLSFGAYNIGIQYAF